MRKDDDSRERTKQYALRVVRLFQALPNTGEASVIGKQLLRSGTSVAANYREASRGRSRAEVRSKLGIVEQELDESLLWLELLADAQIIDAQRLEPLRAETDELIRITVASIRKLRSPPS
ncbi:four helix bundle protein [Botrimarina sp.]|uniref:four helix bundle protein n=1 Tax=Botrimarina sp. TaxID=2795802 RepID=UPI0032EF0B74